MSQLRRLALAVLVCALALVAGNASAGAARAAETRVWGFWLSGGVCVGLIGDESLGKHQGSELAAYDFASGYALAAEGGLNVADDVAVATNQLCFPAGTLILTPSGQVPIEELKVGEAVYAFHEETGEVVVRNIEETFENITDLLVEISYVGGRIAATSSHPVWIDGVGWLPARDVEAGMRLRTPDGAAEVLEVGTSEAEQLVYNFSVAEEHNYFAGKRPVLVHNQDVSFGNYNGAINKALGWLRGQGVDTSTLTEVRQSRIGNGRGLAVPGGGAGFRVEWDPRTGAHVNAWAHKAKSPHFKFPGNAKSVQTLVRMLYCR